MNASDRIRIKKAILGALAPLGWSEIDLTLSEFGLPITDDWRGAETDYIVKSLYGADDNVLGELALHLNIGADPNPGIASPLPGFWTPGAFRLFVSHLAEQKDRGIKLKNELEPYNISCFVAHEDIEPTSDWQREIESALRTMDALIAIVTPGFRNSAWADQEIGFSLGSNKLVVPLRVDGTDPHGFVARHQAISVMKKDTPDVVGKKVFQSLCKHNSTSSQMAAAMVARLEGSPSGDRTKKTLTYLEQFEILGPELLHRMKKAYEVNNRVSGVTDAATRINSILSNQNYQGGLIDIPTTDDDIPF